MHQIRPFPSYQSLLLAKPASHFVFAQPHFLCVRRVHAQQAPHRLEPQRAKRFFALRQSDPAQELPQTVGIAEQLDETLPMSEFDAHGFEILLAERVEIVAIHIALFFILSLAIRTLLSNNSPYSSNPATSSSSRTRDDGHKHAFSPVSAGDASELPCGAGSCAASGVVSGVIPAAIAASTTLRISGCGFCCARSHGESPCALARRGSKPCWRKRRTTSAWSERSMGEMASRSRTAECSGELPSASTSWRRYSAGRESR